MQKPKKIFLWAEKMERHEIKGDKGRYEKIREYIKRDAYTKSSQNICQMDLKNTTALLWTKN